MSNYNEYEEILSQHFSGATLEELKNILNKAKQYDEIKINPIKWYIAGMNQATLNLAGLIHKNEILKDGIKVLLKTFGGIEEKHCGTTVDNLPEFDFFTFGYDQNNYLFDIDSINDDATLNEDFNKIKAMLEVLKNE